MSHVLFSWLIFAKLLLVVLVPRIKLMRIAIAVYSLPDA